MKIHKLERITKPKHNSMPTVWEPEDFKHSIQTILSFHAGISLEEMLDGSQIFQIPTTALRNLLDYYKYSFDDSYVDAITKQIEESANQCNHKVKSDE